MVADTSATGASATDTLARAPLRASSLRDGTRCHSYQKPALIINAASGSTEDIREEAKALAARHGLELRAEYLEPEDISDAVGAILEWGCDLLVTFGGDGTSRASGKTAIDNDIPFVPLPGGTMNMLPRLLYGDVGWREALQTALASEERWHPRGEANGEVFFCGGFFGKPARFNAVREAARDGDLAKALEKFRDLLADVDLDDAFRFGPPDAPEASRAVLVNVNAPGMSADNPVRPEGDNALLVTGMDPSSPIDLFALGVGALTGGVGKAESAHRYFVLDMVLYYGGKPDVLLDGEPIKTAAPIRLDFMEQGVRVLAPRLQPGETYRD